MLQRNRLCLHATHGKAGHGAMRLIGERTEIGVNVRDQLIDENRLNGAILKLPMLPILASLVIP
jgi:hypothetical protein